MNDTSKTHSRFLLLSALVASALVASQAVAAAPPLLDIDATEFRVIATNKTSTLERELNQAAADGYILHAMMAGDTGGGKELVVVMSRSAQEAPAERLQYKVLATNKTSTMERELAALGSFGYRHRAQSVAETTFGGRQVLVILERDRDDRSAQYEYRVLATKRTSTMQSELNEVAREGHQLAGLTVAETAFGGNEVLAIVSRW